MYSFSNICRILVDLLVFLKRILEHGIISCLLKMHANLYKTDTIASMSIYREVYKHSVKLSIHSMTQIKIILHFLYENVQN